MSDEKNWISFFSCPYFRVLPLLSAFGKHNPPTMDMISLVLSCSFWVAIAQSCTELTRVRKENPTKIHANTQQSLFCLLTRSWRGFRVLACRACNLVQIWLCTEHDRMKGQRHRTRDFKVFTCFCFLAGSCIFPSQSALKGSTPHSELWYSTPGSQPNWFWIPSLNFLALYPRWFSNLTKICNCDFGLATSSLP